MSAPAAITLEGVHVRFPLLHATSHRSLKKALVAGVTGGAIMRDARAAPVVHALADVSLRFEVGDRVGLVGLNGAGKSTLLRVLAGVYEPEEGYVSVQGRVAALLNINLGFNPEMTGRENLRLRGLYMGLRAHESAALVPEIAAFTELGEYLDLPVRTYSSGMQMRLALGMATAVQPDILLMDEWLLAGDAPFMQRARRRVEGFVQQARILVLASHSASLIRTWCNKAVFLEHGRVRASGPVEEVMAAYEVSTTPAPAPAP